MNPDRDFDRLLDQWFADGPREVADRVVGQVADRIERQSQRPAWRLPGRDFLVNRNLRWIAAAAVLAVAALTGTKLLGAPSPGAGGPSPIPSASPSPSPAGSPTRLHATAFGVPLSLALVGGWAVNGVENSQIDLWYGGVFVGPNLGFHPLRLVTLPGPTQADPWIPVPADFVAWIKGRPEYVVGDPRPVTVGGRMGTEIDGEFVWKAGTPPQDLVRYGTGAWRYDQLDAGARIRYIIVPGPSGEGVMLVMVAKDADFDAAAAALDALLATVQFDAPAPSPSS